jgi:hypothetical protein
MENNHGNREFEMLLKLFVKGLNSRNPKSEGRVAPDLGIYGFMNQIF